MQAIWARGFHHLPGLAAVQTDDLQDDFLFARRQRALLIGHFQQLLVFGVGQPRRRRRDRGGKQTQNKICRRLRDRGAKAG